MKQSTLMIEKKSKKFLGNKNMKILDQHIHGAYGVDFNKCNADEVLFVAKKLREHGVVGFFPTLVTDSVENIRRQISVLKEAAKHCSGIIGAHLEGIFINPEKKGIHNPEHCLPLTVDNYKLVEDDFIKIVTLAPELDNGLIEYLHSKNVKVQAGHCKGWGDVDGVTHVFNAMSGIKHKVDKTDSTALRALIEDDVYTEVIADGVHVSDEALKLLFRTKPDDKILLISDALPITNSNIKETVFADSKIHYDGQKATSDYGTTAGSTTLLDGIIARLKSLGLFKEKYIENTWKYHGLNPQDFE